jgi:hypothetical protein
MLHKGDKQTKHITLLSKTFFVNKTIIELVKGVSKIHIDALAELIPPFSSTKSLSMNLIDSAVFLNQS